MSGPLTFLTNNVMEVKIMNFNIDLKSFSSKLAVGTILM